MWTNTSAKPLPRVLRRPRLSSQCQEYKAQTRVNVGTKLSRQRWNATAEGAADDQGCEAIVGSIRDDPMCKASAKTNSFKVAVRRRQSQPRLRGTWGKRWCSTVPRALLKSKGTRPPSRANVKTKVQSHSRERNQSQECQDLVKGSAEDQRYRAKAKRHTENQGCEE